MAEQKLPKLHATAQFRHPESKTPLEIRVLNQTLGFWVQINLRPAGRQSNGARNHQHEGACNG